MEKNRCMGTKPIGNVLRNTFLVMRLTVIFVCLFVLGGRASVLSQYRVNVKLGETTYKHLFEEIRKQTVCIVMYSDDMLDKNAKVKATFENVTLDNVLREILADKGLTFEKNAEFITIFKAAAAQQNSIVLSGKVTDKAGNPLPGVSVLVKGTSLGVATDVNGTYKLEIPKIDGMVLSFSFIGMKTKEVNYAGQKELDVVLEEELSEMDEVVVTGYQKIERRKLTSSITTVDMETLKTVNQPNIDKLLQGQVPGMTIMSTSGAPGAVPQIRIRGTSTISGNVQPLWVVDGVILDDPVDATVDDILTNRNLIASGIGGVNVDDIESISVLKDAAATAIYGTRAANGVIVITSKKGNVGKTRITYNGSVHVGMRPELKDAYMMNSKERIDVNMEMIQRGVLNTSSAKANEYGTCSDFERYFVDVHDRKLTWSQFEDKVKELETVNTDWFKYLFRNAITHRHSLSISGGNEKTTFYVSGSYMDEQHTAKEVGQQVYTGLVKVNTYLRENIRLGASLNASMRDNKSFFAVDSWENPYEWAIYTTRAQKAYDENGDYNYMYYNGVKYNFLENRDKGWRNSKNFGVTGNLDFEWRLFPDLIFTSLFSFNKQNTRDTDVATSDSYFVRQRKENVYQLDGYYPVYIWKDGGYRGDNDVNASSITFRNQLSYMPMIKDIHRIDIMIGAEIRTSKREELKNTVYGYTHERGHQMVPQWDLIKHVGTPYWNENLDRTAAVSYFGALGYTLMNRYTISVNARTDGSNRFGIKTNDLFQPLWSVGFNYQMKEENFLKDKEWLSYLTLRGSYGSQGNVASQAYSDLITRVATSDGINPEGYLTISAPKNPGLKWEKNYTSNIALEFGFLKRRIYGTLEYYYKKGVDLLGTKEVSQVTGFNTVSVNWAAMKNSGVEFSINTINIDTDQFRWTTNLNFGYNKNEVTDVYSKPTVGTLTNANRSSYESAAVIGKPINGLWSYRYAGLNEDGRATFYNDKDEKVLYGMNKVEGLKYSGTTQPLLQGGFTNSFYYKNFTLSALFIGSFGNVIRLRNLSEGYAFGFPDPTKNMSKEWANRWRKPGDEVHTDVPVLETDEWAPEVTGGSPYNAKMYDNSDLRTVKGDFVRLQNLSLSYDLFSDKMRAKGIQNIRFMIQGNNLHAWHNRKLKGQDPEATGSQMKYSDARTANVSFGNTYLPIPRSYSFSVSLQF